MPCSAKTAAISPNPRPPEHVCGLNLLAAGLQDEEEVAESLDDDDSRRLPPVTVDACWCGIVDNVVVVVVVGDDGDCEDGTDPLRGPLDSKLYDDGGC